MMLPLLVPILWGIEQPRLILPERPAIVEQAPLLGFLPGIAGIMPGASGAGSAGLATRYRINISAVQGGGANFPGICEIEMASSVGGTDLCSGGTATASATAGGSFASNAFDNNTGTGWSAGTTTVPQWIEYQFASAETIAEVRITALSINDAPANFTIEYHDGSAWQVLKTVTGVTWAATLEKRNFPIGGKCYQVWRLQGVTTQTLNRWVQCSEIEFRLTPSGADECSGGTARASLTSGGNIANNAFDNNTATVWQPNNGTPSNQWIEYHFTADKDIHEVSLRNSATANDSWAAFKIQAHDSDSLVDVWSVSGQTWGASETKVFTKP